MPLIDLGVSNYKAIIVNPDETTGRILPNTGIIAFPQRTPAGWACWRVATNERRCSALDIRYGP